MGISIDKLILVIILCLFGILTICLGLGTCIYYIYHSCKKVDDNNESDNGYNGYPIRNYDVRYDNQTYVSM